jgi:hypothetical protein
MNADRLIEKEKEMNRCTRVQAGWNISTVVLRVVGGDKKGN